MSKKWVKSVSVIVLVSFLALLLPKSWWHDCSHSTHSTAQKHTKSGLSFNQGTEKCIVCDLHIPLLSKPIRSMELAQKPVSLKEKVWFRGSAVFGACYAEPQRGPPAMM